MLDMLVQTRMDLLKTGHDDARACLQKWPDAEVNEVPHNSLLRFAELLVNVADLQR